MKYAPIIIGYGNVGKACERTLHDHGLFPAYIVESTGIYTHETMSAPLTKTTTTFTEIAALAPTAFIAVPSIASDPVLRMYTNILTNGGRVITCEKATLAYHWNELLAYRTQLRYTATVGGNSGILPALTAYTPASIHTLEAVLNGTLNFVHERMQLSPHKEQVFEEAKKQGYCEPSAQNFTEMIEAELHDVRLKTTILANHSGMYTHTITPKEVEMTPFRPGYCCSVRLTPTRIEAGYITPPQDWFPKGIMNSARVNGTIIASGKGAGAMITAERMYTDFRTF